MPTDTLTNIVVRKDQGRIYPTGEGALTFKISAEQTGGVFAFGYATTEPGGGPPIHTHTQEDELFIIIEGTFEFTVKGDKVIANAGDVIFSPRGTQHTFKNIGETEGKSYLVVTGGNFEKFYERYAAEIASGNPDFQKLVGIAEEHGIHMG